MLGRGSGLLGEAESLGLLRVREVGDREMFSGVDRCQR